MCEEHIPSFKLFFILRQCACKIVDVNIDSGNVTITHVSADVGLTDSKEVWTQSSNGVLTNIGGALVYGSTEHKSADQLVTVEDKTWDGVIGGQLISRRFING